MLGGAYLCYEGTEKLYHALFHRDELSRKKSEVLNAFHNSDINLMTFEQEKIKGAIRTDFVLSAEIIVIALGTVQTTQWLTQVSVVSLIAVLMTIGVYGFVAVIVKLDDAGFYLLREQGDGIWYAIKRLVGKWLVGFAPILMKWLTILGTVAMFLVGGGILTHGIPYFVTQEHEIEHWMQTLPTVGSILGTLAPMLFNVTIGLLAGIILVAGHGFFRQLPTNNH